jgi:hypothetical protein
VKSAEGKRLTYKDAPAAREYTSNRQQNQSGEQLESFLAKGLPGRRQIVKMPHVGISLEPQLSQECQLCGQGIRPQRQMPVNAILIHGHGMCPSCRQLVSSSKQDEEEYCRNWRLFVLGLKLDT